MQVDILQDVGFRGAGASRDLFAHYSHWLTSGEQSLNLILVSHDTLGREITGRSKTDTTIQAFGSPIADGHAETLDVGADVAEDEEDVRKERDDPPPSGHQANQRHFPEEAMDARFAERTFRPTGIADEEQTDILFEDNLTGWGSSAAILASHVRIPL